MPTLVRWYERHAKDCVQAARRTDNLRHREHLLRLAYEWASAATSKHRVNRCGRERLTALVEMAALRKLC